MNSAMRKTILSAAVALLAAAVLVALARPVHAAGRAEVQFIEPQKFADAGTNGIERERTLALLAAHVQDLAKRLPDGQVLRVQVLDVDLAGTLQMRRAQELRVLRGTVDAPRLQLRWTLDEGERTVRSGDENLTELGYPLGRAYPYASEGGLPYEKRLLSEWFQARFVTMAR